MYTGLLLRAQNQGFLPATMSLTTTMSHEQTPKVILWMSEVFLKHNIFLKVPVIILSCTFYLCSDYFSCT